MLDVENAQYEKALSQDKPVYVYNDKTKFDNLPPGVLDNLDAVIIKEEIPEFIFGDRGTSKFIIVITRGENYIALWKQYKALNIVVMLRQNGITLFASWSPYINCPSDGVQVLGVCLNGAVHSSLELFPNKIPKRFKNCKFNVGAHVGSPYTLENEANNTLYGPQQVLTKLITDHMEVNVTETITRFGSYGTNSTGRLINRLCDILFGTQIRDLENYGRASFTPSFFQGEYVLVVPTPRSDMFSSLYSGFSTLTWSLIVLSVVAMICFLTVSNLICGEFQSYSIQDVIRTALGNSVLGRPDHFFTLKVIVIVFELYSLHIIWFYQITALSNLFRGSLEKPIKTLEDAADRKLSLLFSDHKIHILNRSDHKTWNRIDFVPAYYPKLHWISEEKRAMWFEEKEGIIYEFKQLYPNIPLSTKISFIKQPIALEQFFLLMPINHPLLPVVSRYVLYINEAGLFNHWMKGINDMGEQFVEIKVQEPLKLSHLEPLFYIMLMMLSLAILSFFTEYFRKAKVSKSCAKILKQKPGKVGAISGKLSKPSPKKILTQKTGKIFGIFKLSPDKIRKS